MVRRDRWKSKQGQVTRPGFEYERHAVSALSIGTGHVFDYDRDT
jgi:hypothetical protein